MSAPIRDLFRPALSVAGLIAAAALAGPAPALSAPLFPPNAVLTADPNPAVVGETVTFDGSASDGDGVGGAIARYEWDLDGDGTFETDTGTTRTASSTYADPRTILVRLRVTDIDGDTDEDEVSIRVHSAPIAGFIFEPSTPAVDEQITFSSTSSDPEGAISQQWDLDADGAFDDAVGQTVTRSFATPGTKTVQLEVTDADGAKAIASRDVLVQANRPIASFTFSPDSPLSGEIVSFDASPSTAPGAQTIAAIEWDLDGDGEFDDASGPTASFSYPTPGPHAVGVRVIASGGGFDSTSRVVPVANRPPVAAFDVLPLQPRAGETVRLVSTSSDPDSGVADQAWDLDADGEYDDATGPIAERSFADAGTFPVGLRVTDANGAATTVTTSIEVGSPRLALLTPFPVIRLTGSVRPSGFTEVERLSVRAPAGSEVTVQCRRGKSCPFDQREKAVAKRRVRFPGLELRLDPKVVIAVFVTKSEMVGKYTKFKLRAGKAPKREDRCVGDQLLQPIPCPPT